jgi:acetyl-CoA acyltransferase
VTGLQDVVVVDAVRTPIGRYGGALSRVRADDLGAHVLKALMERNNVPLEDVEEVVMGCANQAGEDNRNVARMASLLAGLPVEVAGSTVNRLCGSGLDAIASAARQIMVGDGKVHIGAGVESMSRAPLAMSKPERAFATGHQTVFDTTLGWRFVNARMEALGHTDPLGQTAENLAVERHRVEGAAASEQLTAVYDVSREAQDQFALRSHQKALAALDEGRFDAEVVPVTVAARDGEALVEKDEGPRRDTSLESLARLRPAFTANGTVTAGNSSSLNDGAAAVLLTSSDYATANGLRPLARIRGIAAAGVPPRIMGIGPVPAVRKVLDRTGLSMGDIGLIELNEAFAAQALAVLHEWGMDAEDTRLNPNGGAIALGHPLGASGARIVTTLVHEMQRREDVQFALATMCIGVGQGIALVLERSG